MKRYKVFDSEAGWYRFCDTLTEATSQRQTVIARFSCSSAPAVIGISHAAQQQSKQEAPAICPTLCPGRYCLRSQTVREPCR